MHIDSPCFLPFGSPHWMHILLVYLVHKDDTKCGHTKEMCSARGYRNCFFFFFSSWFHLLWFWMMSLGRRIARVCDRSIGFGFLVLLLQSRICGWSLSWKPLLGRALPGETPPYSGLLRVADLSKSPPHLVLATAISYNLSHPLPPLSILQQNENFI